MNVYAKETDLSSVKLATSDIQSLIVTCGPYPAKTRCTISRIGRLYTSTEFASHGAPLPSKFKFKTRRAAKLFFQKPMRLVGSEKQFLALFGSPQPAPLWPAFHKMITERVR